MREDVRGAGRGERQTLLAAATGGVTLGGNKWFCSGDAFPTNAPDSY